MMTASRRVMAVGLLGGMVFAGVGCGGGSVPNSINVSMSDQLRAAGTSVELDVVGVNTANLSQWQGYSVDKYFSGSDALRSSAADAKKTLVFSKEKNAPQSIDKSDPIWKKWKDTASALVLVAQIPGASGQPGTDPRRLVLPLEKGMWKDKTFQVEVTSAGLKNNTTPAPKKD